MEKLQNTVDDAKKYHGKIFDDKEIAKEMKVLQKQMLTNQEVIHFMTKMNHLELRVKNVAIQKLLRFEDRAATDSIKTMLADMILEFKGKHSGENKKKLMRMSTKFVNNDGLIKRLNSSLESLDSGMG